MKTLTEERAEEILKDVWEKINAHPSIHPEADEQLYDFAIRILTQKQYDLVIQAIQQAYEQGQALYTDINKDGTVICGKCGCAYDNEEPE